MNKIIKIIAISLFGLTATSTSVFATDVIFDQNAAQTFCKEKWSKRGVIDSRMFSFCMGQQTEGYSDTMFLYNKYSNIEKVELIDEVVSYALAKWATQREYQLNMVAFEIKKQGEAYLNIDYDLNNNAIDTQKLNSCKEKWISNGKPQWNMVEYCLKK